MHLGKPKKGLLMVMPALKYIYYILVLIPQITTNTLRSYFSRGMSRSSHVSATKSTIRLF
ncbi:unnamed protein product [Nippostrongylus brasiliensis]|uniref:Secreted protein n=1 Tax=Nippostrongylus brasiliensis TaxID=27835 RepID=A0A0N4XH08_NIPBR|nr:unnamed protein product [Nippostrongylus brasiliensis]